MPGSGHPLHAVALINQPLGTPLMAIAAYLVVLITMLVLGVFMGWDRSGRRGDGGRGGTRRPPERQPGPDDGGRPLDPAEPSLADHLAAWESQLAAGGDQVKTPDQEDAPVGTS